MFALCMFCKCFSTYINCFCFEFFYYVSFWNLFLYHVLISCFCITFLFCDIVSLDMLLSVMQGNHKCVFFCDIRNVMSFTVKWHQIKNINCKNQNVMENFERQCIYSTGRNWIIWMQTKNNMFSNNFDKMLIICV